MVLTKPNTPSIPLPLSMSATWLPVGLSVGTTLTRAGSIPVARANMSKVTRAASCGSPERARPPKSRRP